MLTDDDIFICENGSPEDLKVYIAALRANMDKRQRGRPPKKGSKMVQTGLWLYENQIQWIKEEAARLGVTASEVLRHIIEKAMQG